MRTREGERKGTLLLRVRSRALDSPPLPLSFRTPATQASFSLLFAAGDVCDSATEIPY